MKAHEIIRNLLDLIDAIDSVPEIESDVSTDDERSRFNQIADILDAEPSCDEYQNEPNEIYLNIKSVTTNAGGGVNGPKHPHDIRVKDPSMYPNQQEF